MFWSETGKPPNKAASSKRVSCPHERSSGFSVHPRLTGMGEARQSQTEQIQNLCMLISLSLSLSLSLSPTLSFFSRWPSIFSNLDHEVKLINEGQPSKSMNSILIPKEFSQTFLSFPHQLQTLLFCSISLKLRMLIFHIPSLLAGMGRFPLSLPPW